jgi:hypothetical protein
MSWMVISDQRLGGNNQDREKAFYGAEAGMEKMTADMGNIFATKGSLVAADLPGITGAPPVIQGITYLNGLGTSTYQVGCPTFPCAAPVAQNATITPPSSYAGMQALITSFTLDVAAQTLSGAEVKLQRQVQLVAIPVFQFGIFSNTDLSFFNGPPFNFGGRVHTNGNLWLAANSGPLYLADKVTVSGQVIRTNLENGFAIGAGGAYSGTVTIATPTANPPTLPPGPAYSNAQWRALAITEGSVLGPSVYGAVNINANPSWNGIVQDYGGAAGMLQTGVPQLNLVSTALGGLQSPVALIRRPVPGEATSNPAQFAQRYFSPAQASLRILLDDYPGGPATAGNPGACNAADMMSLVATESVSATAPMDLATLGNIAQSGATSGTYNAANGYWQAAGQATITGCIKIEYVTAAGVATDVTNQFLNTLGYIGKNGNPQGVQTVPPALPVLPPSGVGSYVAPSPCAEVSLNAVIRIERVRDNPSNWPLSACGNAAGLVNTDYWPNVLYDTREGIPRPGVDPGGAVVAGGVMFYIELDVANLVKWFNGTLPGGTLGTNANGVGGYEVYFSDRRGNAIDPVAGSKIGSLEFNDFVNPASASACPNGVLDQGEDIESDTTLRVIGGTAMALKSPLLPGLAAIPNLQPNTFCGATAPALWDIYTATQEARENPDIFFRRALKLVHGSTINLGTACYGAAPNPPCGLTIASENPVYIQGDYNAPGGNIAAAGTVATSVAADAVTLLSGNWNDVNTFISPYDYAGRTAVQTSYRVAIIAGKGIPFPQPPTDADEDFGTDGGVHNFLRYLENWNPAAGQASLIYEGSLVSFYYNRQAVGLYKTGSFVYNPPNRVYTFDTNFSQGPQWLPPRTPTLRAINTIAFSQMLMPTQ